MAKTKECVFFFHNVNLIVLILFYKFSLLIMNKRKLVHLGYSFFHSLISFSYDPHTLRAHECVKHALARSREFVCLSGCCCYSSGVDLFFLQLSRPTKSLTLGRGGAR